ncbi:MAG: hypothetical protein HOQ03_07775 [Thermoleophilia bacterium]|nr:hypothetical protein [Thermoleophilia bacterium]
MTTSHLLVAFTIGTAALALWAYVRWPDAAPRSLRGALVRAALALVLLQLGGAVLGAGVEAAPGLATAVAVVVLVVVPVLTYAFLASIWFLKACADQLR